MNQSYSDFNPNAPFTVYEQPHQGKQREWKCNDAQDFINRCNQAYRHSCTWHEMSDEDKQDWNEVRRYIASDMQWCVLIND